MRTSVLRLTVRVMLALMIVGTASLGIAATASATQATNTFQNVRVRGTTDAGGAFRGRVDILKFRELGGELVAVGELSGRVLDAQGDPVGRPNDKPVNLPVDAQSGPAGSVSTAAACEVLDLHLGPLDLNLLGLQVHLNEIVLHITAQPGPGNLLGNLPCAIAGLLDPGGLNAVLAQLLNVVRQLLNIFG